jgi:23S rRNA (cytosine1962-C5)-methyltransferase
MTRTRPPADRPQHARPDRAPSFSPPKREAAPERRPAPRPRGPRKVEEAPGVLLETAGWSDYQLLDMGDGEKLERYGGLTVVRPEPQAMGPRRLSPKRWEGADAVFTGDTDEEGPGRWRHGERVPESWEMHYGDIAFLGRLTSFRHTGVFPEQTVHWEWAAERIRERTKPKVLNLFGYTGLASLTAALAGAEVTHVDASKKAVAWARENQAMSGLEALPIRWIIEDAMRFVEREVRRGSRYQGIVLDPPKFGRGTNGEVWDLFTDLPTMLGLCRELLAPDARFLILTAYSIRASFMSIHELVADVIGDLPGRLESGELIIRESGGPTPGRGLSTSMFARWSAP